MNEVDVAEIFNFIYDEETGDLYLKFKVVDPVWKQKILREWNKWVFKLVIEEKNEEDSL